MAWVLPWWMLQETVVVLEASVRPRWALGGRDAVVALLLPMRAARPAVAPPATIACLAVAQLVAQTWVVLQPCLMLLALWMPSLLPMALLTVLLPWGVRAAVAR